ncbi:MAG: cation:proton antiporter [Clostridia bacterium]
MNYKIFLDLAVILLATKSLGILMRKLGLPQVVGALLAGLVIGPLCIMLTTTLFKTPIGIEPSLPLKVMAEIGVVMLMFTAGMETNLKEIKSNGVAAIVITSLGVIVPLGLGFLLAVIWHGDFKGMDMNKFLQDFFFGVILTATSVGITVEVLKELGKVKGKVGTSILSAAILDDIIGIVILTIVIGMKNNDVNAGMLILRVLGFFVSAIIVGILGHMLFKHFSNKKNFQLRRLPIFSLAFCFFMAWSAEAIFKIADITGAFIAGIVLSNMKSTEYIERKIDINSYMIFSPIFFANIGICADFSGFTWSVLLFGFLFVCVGLFAKFVGCGIGAKVCGYNTADSLKCGVGMMARGEVALIVATKGIESGLLAPTMLPAVLMLVICSSFLTPILLKVIYKSDEKKMLAKGLVQGELSDKTDNIVSNALLSNIETPFDANVDVVDQIIKTENEDKKDEN